MFGWLVEFDGTEIFPYYQGSDGEPAESAAAEFVRKPIIGS